MGCEKEKSRINMPLVIINLHCYAAVSKIGNQRVLILRLAMPGHSQEKSMRARYLPAEKTTELKNKR